MGSLDLNRNNIKRELNNSLSNGLLETEEAKKLKDFLDKDIFNAKYITGRNLSNLRKAIGSNQKDRILTFGEQDKIGEIADSQIDSSQNISTSRTYRGTIETQRKETVNKPTIETNKLDYREVSREFYKLNIIDRKKLQEKIETKQDGKFGPNTFSKLKNYININYPNGQIPSLDGIINGDTQNVEESQNKSEQSRRIQSREQNPQQVSQRRTTKRQPVSEIERGPFGFGSVTSTRRTTNENIPQDNSDDLIPQVESREISTGIKQLLNFISKAEGTNGNYNAIFGNGGQDSIKFTQMTIGEVLAYQRLHARKTGSSAIGKYQIMQYTLKDLVRDNNISMNEKFTEELQDKLGVKLLERRGLQRFQSGRLSLNRFIHNLAQEWASLPKNRSGKSYHHGDKMGNRALVSYNDIYSAVSNLSLERHDNIA